MNVVSSTLNKLESKQAFTEKDAWGLFKLAAIGEACGWTLLISGILCKRYITVGNNVPVLIAGQVHGMLFLIYIVAVVVTYSSLHWSRKRMLVAGIASVPPYGSLIFEQWAAYQRRSQALKIYREISVRAVIVQQSQLLVVQPKDSGYWYLPGGYLRENETVKTALKNIVTEQTGIVPDIGQLLYIVQARHKKTEQLELYFRIRNTADYQEKSLLSSIKKLKTVDEISYIHPEANDGLMPEFLRSEPVITHAQQKNPAPIII